MDKVRVISFFIFHLLYKLELLKWVEIRDQPGSPQVHAELGWNFI